jgi:trehalose utilization protein
MGTRSLMKPIAPFGIMAWLVLACSTAMGDPIKVLVWDERQPRQKEAYPNFLGNQIAAYLQTRPGMSVRPLGLDDPQQGLSEQALDNCDVLIWWGHVRQDEVSAEKGRQIVQRVRDGRLSLLVLHSAHWSTAFVEAMNARAREDALRKLPEPERKTATFKFVDGGRFKAPKRDTPLTPSATCNKKPDGSTEITLTLPNCCFPAYRPDGGPSQTTTLLPQHPIARGIPREFTIPQTEMYDEPFHVPAPDLVVFEERWETGEHFRSGCVWNIGKGKLFYFRPGHETYKAFFQPVPLKIIENAVRWMAAEAAP